LGWRLRNNGGSAIFPWYIRAARYYRSHRKGGDFVQEALSHVTPDRDWSVYGQARRAWPAVALYAGYVALCLALDRLSFIEALYGIGITPWNPSTGLTVALLILKGPRCFPIVMAAEVLSGATLRLVPIPASPIFVAAFAVTAGYTSAVALLRHIGFDASLRRSVDLTVLFGVMIISSGLVASSYVATYFAAGVVPWTGILDAVFQFWIGDAIAIVVLAPPLLILNRPGEQPKALDHDRQWLGLLELLAQAASIVAALAVMFSPLAGGRCFGLFYVLFLPLVWIATRRGLAAASWAVLAIQAGLVAGLEVQDQLEATLRAFQLLMFALAVTGLMLGAVVSERHRLSRALAESESRRATILNTARDGVLTINARGQIQSINPAIERLFARSGHLLIGHDIRELVDAGPELLSRLSRISCSPPVEATCWELDAKRADGRLFPIELSVGRFEPSEAEHYTLVIRDVTLRQKAEARAREHQTELAHASRVSLAGEMAAGLAHELSQPLTAIAAYGRGCLRLLAEPAHERPILHEGVSEIVQQAERTGDILVRLREFVRRGAYQRTLVEVARLIDAAVRLARIEATQHGVRIEVRVDPDLPPVLADNIQIEQVMLNLLKNAVDAIESANSERRSIIIEAGRKDSSTIEISVTDSGPGIAEELEGRIFDSFMTTKPFGMGLGLSISRSIIEAHGGILRVVQSASSGASFAFDLPTAGPKTSRHANEDCASSSMVTRRFGEG
jgi:PAS domain S-box-containing protein